MDFEVTQIDTIAYKYKVNAADRIEAEEKVSGLGCGVGDEDVEQLDEGKLTHRQYDIEEITANQPS